jgi:succinate dehydrogenase / fumarate reductase, cytochrome b subunit
MSFLANASDKKRPEFRNIHISQIVFYRMPPPALVSIMHRVSGALLFLALPLLLWLFELSLTSEITYERLVGFVAHPLSKLVLLALIWSLLHHLVAGIRYLILDLHIGLDLGSARASALAVYAVSLPLTLIAALFLFGVI